MGFTSKQDEIENALKTAQAGGLTAMLDAVNLTLGQMKKAKNSRKAIVIISDGGDNHSHYRSPQIEALVREADVQIYAMGVFDPLSSFGLAPEVVSGPRLLSEIATQTGGRAFAATAVGDLPSIAARIAVELRNEYVLGYYPKNSHRRKISPSGSKGYAASRRFDPQGPLAPGLLRSRFPYSSVSLAVAGACCGSGRAGAAAGCGAVTIGCKGVTTYAGPRVPGRAAGDT